MKERGLRWGLKMTTLAVHVFYDVLPLDVMRLIVQFLFKSTEFRHVMRFLRVSKRMMELLEIGWMRRLYEHEWYLYQRRRLSKEGFWYARDELQCLKRKRDMFGFRRITSGNVYKDGARDSAVESVVKPPIGKAT